MSTTPSGPKNPSTRVDRYRPRLIATRYGPVDFPAEACETATRWNPPGVA